MTISKEDRNKVIVIVLFIVAALLLYLWYRSKHVPSQSAALPFMPGSGVMPSQLSLQPLSVQPLSVAWPSIPLPQYNIGGPQAEQQMCGCGPQIP